MSRLKEGGYHWQAEAHVARWDGIQEHSASERGIAFREIIARLPVDRDALLAIVDLGAGDGKVAGVVLDVYPLATAALVDFSAPMMAKGREQLARFGGRWRYEIWDMNEGDWPASLPGPFDATISSAAIHHLANGRKQWLAEAVMARLAPGGLFANYDLFRDPDATFAEEDVHGQTCATIAEATEFLRRAGYVDIEVIARTPRPQHQGELALLTGRKPLVQSSKNS